MANAYRYTGKDCVFRFNGVIISTDWTSLDVEHSIRIEEKTAGNELDASYNTTIREGKASMKSFDTAENDAGQEITLAVGATGLFEVFKKGIATGRRVEAWPAIVTSAKTPIAFDKNTMREIEFTKNGAFVSVPGTAQP